jgi:hypothetical protein
MKGLYSAPRAAKGKRTCTPALPLKALIVDPHGEENVTRLGIAVNARTYVGQAGNRADADRTGIDEISAFDRGREGISLGLAADPIDNGGRCMSKMCRP